MRSSGIISWSIAATPRKVEVVIVAIKSDLLDEINDVGREFGVKTTHVDVAPMAIYNAFRYNYSDLERLLADHRYRRPHDQPDLCRAPQDLQPQHPDRRQYDHRGDCQGI